MSYWTKNPLLNPSLLHYLPLLFFTLYIKISKIDETHLLHKIRNLSRGSRIMEFSSIIIFITRVLSSLHFAKVSFFCFYLLILLPENPYLWSTSEMQFLIFFQTTRLLIFFNERYSWISTILGRWEGSIQNWHRTGKDALTKRPHQLVENDWTSEHEQV